MFEEAFAARVEQLRATGRPLLDLTDCDPVRSGLIDAGAALASAGDAGTAPVAPARTLAAARDAVASYLAGRGAVAAPARILFAPSRRELFARLLDHLCRPGDEVLVPSPGEPLLAPLAEARGVALRRYALAYRGAWSLDRRSLARAVTPRTRAVVVGSPSEPTGTIPTRDDLAFVDALCGDRGIALVGDEAHLDTALVPATGVLEARQAVAFHVSGLGGVCGLPGVQAEWLAVGGADALAGAAASALEQEAGAAGPAPGLALVPALLARREPFQEARRARLVANRTALATAALGERAWSARWGQGGCWAVLEVGAAQGEESLCLSLLDDGVAVLPGSLHGLPAEGYLVVSLLPPLWTFREALAVLDRRLRTPLVG